MSSSVLVAFTNLVTSKELSGTDARRSMRKKDAYRARSGSQVMFDLQRRRDLCHPLCHPRHLPPSQGAKGKGRDMVFMSLQLMKNQKAKTLMKRWKIWKVIRKPMRRISKSMVTVKSQSRRRMKMMTWQRTRWPEWTCKRHTRLGGEQRTRSLRRKKGEAFIEEVDSRRMMKTLVRSRQLAVHVVAWGIGKVIHSVPRSKAEKIHFSSRNPRPTSMECTMCRPLLRKALILRRSQRWSQVMSGSMRSTLPSLWKIRERARFGVL